MFFYSIVDSYNTFIYTITIYNLGGIHILRLKNVLMLNIILLLYK